jgi:hypothetical protein
MNNITRDPGFRENAGGDFARSKQVILEKLLDEQSRLVKTRHRRMRTAVVSGLTLVVAPLATCLIWSFLSGNLENQQADGRVVHSGDAASSLNDPVEPVVSIAANSIRSSQPCLIEVVRTDTSLAKSIVFSTSPGTADSFIKQVSDSELVQLVQEHAPELFVAQLGNRHVVLPKKRVEPRGGQP